MFVYTLSPPPFPFPFLAIFTQTESLFTGYRKQWANNIEVSVKRGLWYMYMEVWLETKKSVRCLH